MSNYAVGDVIARTLSPPSKISGFTFVELTIVMVIVGVILASAAQGLTVYYQKVTFDRTRDNIASVESELRKYIAANNAYPCPALLDIARETADYGTPDCPDAISVTGADGVSIVRIGAVPTRALGISDAASIDGWGQKLVYAVTESLTVAPIMDVDTNPLKEGAISVVNKAGDELTDPGKKGHYVVYSPGPDGKGAYTSAGVQVEICSPDAVDRENCDFDNAVFVYSEERSLAGNEHNYDDLVAFRSTLASSDGADCDPDEVVIDFVNGEAECGPLPPLSVDACAPYQYLAGITDGLPECRSIPDCAAGQYLRGINIDGGPDCQALPNEITADCGAGRYLQGVTGTTQTCGAVPTIPSVPVDNTTCGANQAATIINGRVRCRDLPPSTVTTSVATASTGNTNTNNTTNTTTNTNTNTSNVGCPPGQFMVCNTHGGCSCQHNPTFFNTTTR